MVFMSANSSLRSTYGVLFLALLFFVLPMLSIEAEAQSQQPIFPVTVFSPGSSAMASGDFKGDGQTDLAYLTYVTNANIKNDTVIVLLDQGLTGNPISVSTNFSGCTTQYQLVAADMNNDKKLDLVFICSEGYIVVMFGNGDGSFQTPSFYAVSGVYNVAAVDLNGDGYLEVVGSTRVTTSSPTVAVLLNQGSSAPGVLANPTSYSGPGEGPIATGDFNGDGKQDVLTASSSQLAVFYGNGDGTLQSPKTISANNGTLITQDFNHDGLTDVAYVTQGSASSSSSLQVLLGNSSGAFTTGVNLPLSGSAYSTVVYAGSTNNGNNINLALISDHTSILLGDGKGGFTLGQSYALSGNALSETDSNGHTNLVFTTGNDLAILAGNGDGTFRGLPTFPVGIDGFVAADVNGDGLTDVLTLDAKNNVISAVGRGDGTFSVASQTTGGSKFNSFVLAGDFNEDGKVDAATILQGNGVGHGATVAQDAELFLYPGNGDGTFQSASPGVDLQVFGAESAVVGDFNGDSHLDVVASYIDLSDIPTFGLVFLPGNGDGTFGTPVPFSTQGALAAKGLLAADLNNDKKLDLIWNNAVYLGNGDGTFKQIPLIPPGSPLAIADLNGDGIPDLVIGASIYAGIGDGTFQTSPFYTASLPQYAQVLSASIGDVNADGHPDLVMQSGNILVLFGDGHGNFVADSNTYYAGNANLSSASFGVLARLNNQAPKPSNANALDYLSFTSGGATSLLNQTNPAPVAPAPLPSKTTLAVSANRAAPNQQLTFTATIGGISPTGTVSFTSGSTSLGTAPISNATAVLPFAFVTSGTYAVTATYAGDSNNLASTSNSISVAVAPVATKTTLAVSANSANQNQQLNFTATVTGISPTGNVSFLSGTTKLGTAAVANGVATLPLSFAAAGSVTVTASYAGDAANLASTSNSVSITVVAPDFSVTAAPAAVTISAGQSAVTTLTITPVGGYTGTVKFSCGTLPNEATCSFAPSTVTPTNGAAATTTLTIATKAPSTAMLRKIARPLSGIAWAGLVFFAFMPRRTRQLKTRLLRSTLVTLMLLGGVLSLSGCSSSSPSPVKDPGTPAGPQSISVTVADSNGGSAHSIPFQVTIN
jgi:hypothetical protein